MRSFSRCALRQLAGEASVSCAWRDALHEPAHVDDEAFVCALADALALVVGLDPGSSGSDDRQVRKALER
jgi:hypothetical protein